MTGPAATFGAWETEHLGIRVDVTITIPAGSTWHGPGASGRDEYRDVLELAQMAASRCMTDVMKCRANAAVRDDEETPF